ncbi:MAG: DUF190 domain-containing protein [Bryobacterales bacterium]|nr:DUF190 domain-containing protein [Bryobacterales bacterium]
MRNENTRTSWTESGVALLRIFVMAGDRAADKPLSDAIVLAAREAGILGATVLPGIAGYGRSGRHGNLEVSIHDPLSQPMVVELADAESPLRDFLPILATLDQYGRLATLERLGALSYHAQGENGPGDSAVST